MPRKKGFFQRLFSETEKGFQQFSENMMRREVSVGQVIYCLDTILLDKKECTTLSVVEKLVAKALESNFEHVYSKYKLDDAMGLRVSADVEGQVGIVCHLAEDLTRAKLLSLLGKIVYLSSRVYPDRLILVLVGDMVRQRSPIVQEVSEIMEELEVAFYYLVVKG